jgi:hypothetical protein
MRKTGRVSLYGFSAVSILAAVGMVRPAAIPSSLSALKPKTETYTTTEYEIAGDSTEVMSKLSWDIASGQWSENSDAVVAGENGKHFDVNTFANRFLEISFGGSDPHLTQITVFRRTLLEGLFWHAD